MLEMTKQYISNVPTTQVEVSDVSADFIQFALIYDFSSMWQDLDDIVYFFHMSLLFMLSCSRKRYLLTYD